MIEQGTVAPTFERPTAIDGEVRQISFERLGVTDHVVVLVFYPADFNAVCTEELASFRDLDLLDLQSDISIVGVSTDSAYSHQAFADQHNLGFPLVSDGDGAIAAAYGVLEQEGLEGHRTVARRSVFVLDADGIVRYAWATDEYEELPDLEAIRTAVEAITDDEAAVERYRIAYRRYRDGLDAYKQGWTAFGDEDWVTAEAAFERAIEPLTDAVDAFAETRRYADDEFITSAATTANEQATDRRNAAQWYAEAARAYATGDTERGQEYRTDANERDAAVDERAEPPHPEALLDRL